MSSGGWISSSSQKVMVIAAQGSKILYSGDRLKDKILADISGDAFEDALTDLMTAIDGWITTSDDLEYRGSDEIDLALAELCNAGAAAFTALAGPDPQRLRDLLRGVVYLEVKVESKHIPWEFLYLGAADEAVDLELFLGSQMVVGRPSANNEEYTNTPGGSNDIEDPADASKFRVGVIEDNTLASARSGAEREIFVAAGLPFRLMTELTRPTDIDILKEFLLRSPFLTHFNCHAEIDSIHAGYSVRMTNRFKVTRRQMSDVQVWEDSVIFLNCCHGHGMLHRSTENTLANTFARKNVGVVIAATHRILDSDGTRWASYFYEALLAGLAIGPSILEARKRMIADTGNPSCLVYSFIGQYNLTLGSIALDFAA